MNGTGDSSSERNHANKRQTIEKKMRELDAHIKGKRSELQQLQSGWTKDTFVTGKMRQELGAMQREWTALSQRRSQLISLDETSSRGSSAVFSGSNF